MSTSPRVAHGSLQGPEGADSTADGERSRLSKNNRQGVPEPVEPSELPGPSRRPLAVRPETSLRDEARAAKVGPGEVIPLDRLDVEQLDDDPEVQARPTYRTVDEWRRWMASYRNSHITYQSDEGERVRAPLENSYQNRYAGRYYAKLKDLERAVERQYDGLTTVFLTLTASHRNAEGNWRCPADHLRDVLDGWDTARKQLHQQMSGYTWDYARILEPHQNGYGHVHVAVFVEDPDDEIEAERFAPVMESHVGRCESAGTDAHRPENAVSVSSEVGTLAGYMADYMCIYSDGESALDRPMNEQVFHATTWATNTRRLDFSNSAQKLIAREKFRRETGLRPEDRGEAGGDGVEGDGTEWTVECLCEVSRGEPRRYDPTAGGVRAGPIDGRDGVDPPKHVP